MCVFVCVCVEWKTIRVIEWDNDLSLGSKLYFSDHTDGTQYIVECAGSIITGRHLHHHYHHYILPPWESACKEKRLQHSFKLHLLNSLCSCESTKPAAAHYSLQGQTVINALRFGMLFTVNYANPRISTFFIMWKEGSIIQAIFELTSFWSQDHCCSWQDSLCLLLLLLKASNMTSYLWPISYLEPDKTVTYPFLSSDVPFPQNLEEKQLPNITYMSPPSEISLMPWSTKINWI